MKNFKNFFQKDSKTNYLIIFTGIFLSILNWTSSFPLVIASNIRADINFSDLFSTLTTADCYSLIKNDVYFTTNQGYCGNYIYGQELLKFLNFFSVGAESTEVIGLIFIISVTLAYTIYLAQEFKLKSSGKILALTLFFSPGISLLMERGNIDAFIFTFMVVFGFLAKKDKFIPGILILSILSLIKFYAFPCLIIYVLMQTRKDRRIFGMFVALLTMLGILASLKMIQAPIPGGGYAQFGVKIIGNYLRNLGIPLNYLEGRLLGYFLFVKFHLNDKEIKIKNFQTPGFFCGVIFVSCYVVSLNYDYRLVFFVPFTFWLHNILTLTKFQKIIYFCLVFSGTWLSAGFGGYFFANNFIWQHYIVNGLQAIGDISLWLIVGITLSAAIQIKGVLTKRSDYINES
jgi:hypothetical protein